MALGSNLKATFLKARKSFTFVKKRRYHPIIGVQVSPKASPTTQECKIIKKGISDEKRYRILMSVQIRPLTCNQ